MVRSLGESAFSGISVTLIMKSGLLVLQYGTIVKC